MGYETKRNSNVVFNVIEGETFGRRFLFSLVLCAEILRFDFFFFRTIFSAAKRSDSEFE